MKGINRQTAIGIAAVFGAIALVAFAIPKWVNTPASVPHLVLSPRFWPYTLAGLLALVGIGLVIVGRHSTEMPDRADDEHPGACPRLAVFLAILVVYVWLMPTLGMVWTSILAFAAAAFLLKTDHPKTAIVCAVVVPLALYAFFAHVAGVVVPQGQFVTLP